MNLSILLRQPPLSRRSYLLAAAAWLHLAATQVSADPSLLINEVDAGTRGNASTGFAGHDFIELRNTSASNKPLDGKSLVFYLGSTASTYGAQDLDSFAIPAGGLLVVGSYATPNADVVIGVNTGAVGSFLNFNAAAISLVDGEAENFINPSVSVTSANLAKISDAFVHDQFAVPFASGSNEAKLLNLLTGGTKVNESANAAIADDSMGRNPVGTARNTSTFKVGTPTPGTSNSETRPILTFEWTSASNTIAENSTSSLTGKITRSGSTTSALTVTLTNKDRSEWNLPATITIAAGSASKSFTATPVDDNWEDGNQTVYLAATAPSYGPTAGWAVINDNPADTPAPVIITEVHSHIFGDANGDGNTNDQDQFIEILNPSTTLAVDLSGFKINDGVTDLYTFPPCSILAPNSAAVIFGGGSNLVEGVTLAFGKAMIFSKNSTTVNLNQDEGIGLKSAGGVVRILNLSGQEISGMTYWPYPGGSNTVNLSNTLQIVGHSVVTGAAGMFSPGKKINGSTYAVPTSELELSYVTAMGGVTPSVSRLSPTGAVKLKIKLPGASPTPLTYPLAICLTDTDLDDNAGTLPANTQIVTLPAGQTSIETDITPVSTPSVIATDETYSYSVVRAAGFLNTTTPPNLKVVGTGHVALTSLASTIVESAGNTASVITYKLDTAESISTVVNFSISPGSGASASLPISSVTIPAGELTAIVPLNAVAGLLASGSQSLKITALADFPVSKGNTVDITVIDDAGLAQGPFINEIQTDPAAGATHEFVELSVPGGSAALTGTYLVVYDLVGAATSVTPLTGSTGASGLYTVRGTGLPAFANSQSATLDLPDTVGAVAVYRGTAPSLPFTVNANGLLDAVVYGSTASATVLQTLLPTVTYPPTDTAGLLGDNGPIVLDSVATKTDVVGRSALGSATSNLRNPSNWRTFPYATPALSNFTAPVLTFSNSSVSRFAPAGTVQLTATLPGIAPEALGYPLGISLTDSDGNDDALAAIVSTTILTGQTAVTTPLTSLRSPIRSTDESVTFTVTAAESLTSPDPVVSPSSLLVKGNAGIVFSPSAASIVESAGATSSVLTLKLPSAVAAPTSFALTLTGGSGAVLAQNTVTIVSGDTAVVALNSVGGTLASGSEILTATIFSTSPAAAALGSDTTVTVVDDAGIANGPFLNEIEADPLNGNTYEYIELVVPTAAVTPLSGLVLVVYDLNGAILQTMPLTGSTNAAGFYLVRDTALPGDVNSQVAALDLPDAAGAVALYRTGTAPSALTSDNLLDAIVYGSGTSDTLRKALLPQVTAGLLSGKGSTSVPVPATTLSVVARTSSAVNAANFRNPPDWSALNYGTPGLTNTASSYLGWGAAFGLNANFSDFTNVNPPDADKDGVPDWLEFITGTNPTLASSNTGWITTPGHTLPTPVPHKFSISLNPIALGDTAHFTITAESSSTLAAPWTDETWTVAPTVGSPVGEIHVPSAPDPVPARKFYRLKVVSTP